MAKSIAEIKSLIRAHPDFPKAGILFQDIFPIFQDPEAVQVLVEHLTEYIRALKADVIVGLDARGFLLGPWIAANLNVAFVPIRKKGKLPGNCASVSYEKEYGVDTFEIQEDAFATCTAKGIESPNVVILDDLLATGGTAAGAYDLVKKVNGKVVKLVFLIELLELKGAEVISNRADGLKDLVYSVYQF